MNTLIKSQPERLAAATAYANHYDGPAIRRIIEANGAKIVISSVWRILS